MKALILTDGKAGHENQSKAFARALGLEFELLELHFKSKAHKALSYLLDRLGVASTSLWDVDLAQIEAKYAVVIGTGSGTFYAVKSLAKNLGVKGGVVLYPRGYRLDTFDCILAPAFDRPAKRKNVIELPANLVANDESFYDEGVRSFLERHQPSDRPKIAVIVGGPNKCSTMTPKWMKRELDKIFAANEGCEFWVTTSRRTPPEVEAVVKKRVWDYRLIYSKDHYNPIPAFVKLAECLYVSAESTGMLSEACTFGTAEVVAMDNLNPGKSKFRRFVEGLREAGYVNGSRKVDLTSQFAAARKLLLER